MGKKLGRRGFLGILGFGAFAAPALLQGQEPTEREELPPEPMPVEEAVAEELSNASLKPGMTSSNINCAFFCCETTERGKIVEAVSGDDDLWHEVKPGQHGNFPIGMLLNDVVDIDLNRHHLNFANSETQLGGKVQIMMQGQVVVAPVGGNAIPGAPLYYDKEGYLTTEEGSVRVGMCLSKPDEDGYVRASIDV